MPLTRTTRFQGLSAGGWGTGNYTSSSFTPASNSLLLAVAMAMAYSENGLSSSSLTITDSVGLTWTSRVLAPVIGWPKGGRMWTAPVSSGQPMTVSIGFSGLAVYGASLCVYEYTDYNVSSPTGATGGGVLPSPSDGPFSFNLSANPLASSDVVAGAIVGIASGHAGGIDPGSGWTELFDQGYEGYGWCKMQVQARTGSTSPTVSWADVNAGSGTAGSSSYMALEIREGQSFVFDGDIYVPSWIIKEPSHVVV